MSDTFIPNLVPNANPLTALLVAYVERSSGIDMRIFRLRDAWLTAGVPEINLLVQLGGDLRGGANSALWGRIRLHPCYLRDADTKIPEYASITFTLKDAAVAAAAIELAEVCPMLCVDPEQKLKDSIDIQMNREPKAYPTAVSREQLLYLTIALAAAVEASPEVKS